MTTSHPDVDELAELAEGGLLSAARTAEIEAHLEGCAVCTELVEAVAMLPSTLADLPLEPLPPAIAMRLDAVLLAESARRQEATVSQPASPAEHATHEQPTRAEGATVLRPAPVAGSRSARARASTSWRERHPRLRTAAAAAASIAVLGSAAALIAPQMSGSSSSETAAEDAAAGSSGAELTQDARRARGGVLTADRLDATAGRLARKAERRPGAAPALGMAEGLRIGMRPS